MPARDDNAAEQYREPRAENAIRNQPARQRGEKNGHRVRAVNRGRSLHVERESAFAQWRDHVEHEDGAHAVITKALPQLREEECGQAARVAAEAGGVGQIFLLCFEKEYRFDYRSSS